MESHSHHHDEDMLSVEEAKERVLKDFVALQPETVKVTQAVGQVLANDVISYLSIPPLDNSAMDGYAVVAGDTLEAGPEHPIYLEVLETVSAGSLPTMEISAGKASRIMTGAPIPAGADAVVPFELTTETMVNLKGPEDSIGILTRVLEGSDIRVAGRDVTQGEKVLDKGSVVKSSTVGLLSALGLSEVSVVRRPRVAILATGDELLEPGSDYVKGKIYDSNTSTLIAAVESVGGIALSLGVAADDAVTLRSKLEQAADCDLIITSAGVSKGDYDLVKDVLEEQGNLEFWSVRMRPAKPLAFGNLNFLERPDPVPLLGLPGNPVSTFVAFEQFARPAIRLMMGKPLLERPTLKASLVDTIHNYDGRRVYARVSVWKDEDAGVYYAQTTGSQESNILTALAYANGLGICPEDVSKLEAGDMVEVMMLDWPEEMI